MEVKQEVKVSKKYSRLLVFLILIVISGVSLLCYRYVHAQKVKKPVSSNIVKEKHTQNPVLLMGTDISQNDIIELESWVQYQSLQCSPEFYDQLGETQEQLKNRESYLNALRLVEDRIYDLKPIAIDLGAHSSPENKSQKSWLSWLNIKRISADHVVVNEVDIARIQTQMLLAVEQLHSQAYHPDQHRMDHIFRRLKADSSLVRSSALDREIEALSHWQAHALKIPHGLLSCKQQGDRHV